MHEDYIKLILIVGAVAAVPFFFALRAMGREITKDAQSGVATDAYSRLTWKFAGIFLSLCFVSAANRSWLPIIAFGWFPAIFAVVILLNNRRKA